MRLLVYCPLTLGMLLALSGCAAKKADKKTVRPQDESEAEIRDPDLLFDPSKISCKSICASIQDCPVKQAHCKKEVDPPVCWSLYYTSDERDDYCFFRKDPIHCRETLPIYCDGDSGLVLKDFRPATTTPPPTSGTNKKPTATRLPAAY